MEQEKKGKGYYLVRLGLRGTLSICLARPTYCLIFSYFIFYHLSNLLHLIQPMFNFSTALATADEAVFGKRGICSFYET